MPFVSAGGTFPAVLLHWMTVFAGAYLYEARGLQDDDESNKIARLKEACEKQIDSYLNNSRRFNLLKASGRDVTAPGMA